MVTKCFYFNYYNYMYYILQFIKFYYKISEMSKVVAYGLFLQYHVRLLKDLLFVSVNFLNKSLNVGSRPTHIGGRRQYGVSYSSPPHSS